MAFQCYLLWRFHIIYLLTDRELSMSSFLAGPRSRYGGDSIMSSGERSNGSGRLFGAKVSGTTTHIIWPKVQQETYIRAGSQIRRQRSIKDSRSAKV